MALERLSSRPALTVVGNVTGLSQSHPMPAFRSHPVVAKRDMRPSAPQDRPRCARIRELGEKIRSAGMPSTSAGVRPERRCFESQPLVIDAGAENRLGAGLGAHIQHDVSLS